MKKFIAFIVALAVSTSSFAAVWTKGGKVDSFTGNDNSQVFADSDNSQNVDVFSRPIKSRIILWTNVKEDEFDGAFVFPRSSQPMGYNGESCSINSCVILLKIDGGEVERVRVEETRGNANEVLYFQDKELAARLRKAKKIEIRLKFFNQGNGTFSWTFK